MDPAVLLPLLLGLAALGLLGWLWHSRRKASVVPPAPPPVVVPSEPPLPEGAVRVRTRSAPSLQADHSGRVMLVLDGTFSANLGNNLLQLLDRCGMGGAIGSILLVELDSGRRERFRRELPAVFANRVVEVEFAGLAGGLSGRHPDEVLEHIDRWGPPVIRGANEVCERHQRLQRGQEAALVLVFVSQGGQALLGTEAVKAIASQFRMAKFFGFTALPVDERLRARAPRVLEAYRKVGVRGFVVSDNLQDQIRNDFGMVAAIAGFIAAAEDRDISIEQNNAWNLLFTETPGGLVSYRTYYHYLPAYDAPPYYVYKSSVVSAIQTALEEVQSDSYAAVAARTQGANGAASASHTSRFDIVLTAVDKADLKDQEDDILMGRYLRGQDRRNYHLLFGSISEEVDPARPFCPITVVSLQAMSPDVLQQLAGDAGAPVERGGRRNGMDTARSLAEPRLAFKEGSPNGAGKVEHIGKSPTPAGKDAGTRADAAGGADDATVEEVHG